jgi:hypothetical protein
MIVVPRPLFAAALNVRRRYLIVVPRLLLGAQAAARGAAPCLSQVLDHGAKAVARGAARCASQVLDCCARSLPVAPRRSLQFAKAGSAATLSQQDKNYSADVQRGGFVPRGDILGR